MHPIFRIDDTLECILRETTSLPDMCRLARTCRTFTEPALNIVWKKLPDIYPLIRCLPVDAWYLKRINNDDDLTLGLRREPLASEWAPIHKHAHRVQSLVLEEEYTQELPFFMSFHIPGAPCAIKLHKSVLFFLSRYLFQNFPTGTVFLPNLRRLSCFVIPKDRTNAADVPACLTRLGGRKLTSLQLTLKIPFSVWEGSYLMELTNQLQCIAPAGRARSYGQMYINEALHLLTRNSPEMEDLSLHFPMSSDEKIHAWILKCVGTCQASMPHLRSFDFPMRISSTWPRFIVPLATSSRLQVLRLHLDASVDLDSQHLPQDGLFPSLIEFYLRAENIESCITLLQAISSSDLGVVDIATAVSPKPSSIDALFHTLHNRPRLTHVGIQFSRSTMPAASTSGLPWISRRALSTFLSSPRVTHVDIRGRVNFDLDDSVIETFAGAWPKLKTLSFVPTSPLSSSSLVTPAALVSLARRCPHFSRLTMGIDAAHEIDASLMDAAKAWKRSQPGKQGWMIVQPVYTSTPVHDIPLFNTLLESLRFRVELKDWFPFRSYDEKDVPLPSEVCARWYQLESVPVMRILKIASPVYDLIPQEPPAAPTETGELELETETETDDAWSEHW